MNDEPVPSPADRPAPVDGAAAAAAMPRPRGRRRWLLGLAGLALALVLPLLVAAVLVGREDGTAWLLGRVPGLQVDQPRGRLSGGDFSARRVVLHWAQGTGSVEIEGLRLTGLRWQRAPQPGMWAGLVIDEVHAESVRVRLPPSTDQPARPPERLHSPLALQVQRLTVQRLQLADAAPLTGLQARLALGAEGGRLHRVEGLAFGWDRVQAHDGRLSIGTDPPFATELSLQAQSRDGPPWTAAAQARGPLEQLSATLNLRGTSLAADHPDPALDARAELRPFETWPLGTLALQTRALDLAALHSRVPTTSLDGQATVRTAGPRAPAEAELTLTNATPGRWDRQRLPVARLQARWQGDLATRDRWTLPAFDLTLADERGEAGRWRGQAALDHGRATLTSRVEGLQPQRLDARAPAMRLGGPLELQVEGVPGVASPAGAWAQARGQFTLTLDGTLEPRRLPVGLSVRGDVARGQFMLQQLQARSGEARAEASARLSLEGSRWHLASTGRLERFDPLTWLLVPDAAPWRRGPHRLSGDWVLDLDLPERSVQRPPLQWLQTLSGTGRLRLEDSLLAGLPLRAELALVQDRDAPAARRSRVSGRVELAGSTLSFDGAGDPLGAGSDDLLQAALQAPDLAALAPLAAWVPALADWTPRRGEAGVRLSLRGRWPALRTEGEARLAGLQAGTLGVGEGRLRWRMDTADAQTLDVQGELQRVALGTQRIDRLAGQVRGTLTAHRFDAELDAPVVPPEGLARSLGLPAGRGTLMRLEGDGAWAADPAGGGRWRTRLQRLNVGVSGAAPDAGASAWFDSSELQAELTIDAAGRLTGVTAPAGAATLAGGIVLRWSEFDWRAEAGRDRLALQARIEPFALAPMLQRWQDARVLNNGTRWSGDLRVEARLDLRADERMQGELMVRRVGGDLGLSDGGAVQALGLDDGELRLAVRDGLWRFSPRFSGRTLGRVSGELTARTAPQRRWPGRDAALDGNLLAEVPNLAVWGGWLPPGWRIDGQLALATRLAGTLGAPELTGELGASRVAVRNLLQGVAYSDGELRVALQGERARIERFSLRGGDGSLQASGDATLGATPQARLAVQAERFRVLGRIDRQLVVSGRSTLLLQADRLRLDGRVAVDRGLFDLSARDAPTLDDDVHLRRDGSPAPARAEVAPVPPWLRNAAVALEIDLGPDLRLRGRGLDTRLAGALQLSAPGGRLAIQGTVRAEDGTYAAYGQKLAIERGLVAFNGPIDGARLDILALRPNLDMRVGVAITGTALAPRVRLFSEPEMGETDKLSWLVLGRGPDGLGRTDTALLQRAAVALLAGEGEGPTDALIRAIGLDDVSVRQTDGEVRETVISLGKQLGRRWYVGYERGVNATAGTWQLIYRIAQRFTLRAQSGLENSLDLIWTWRFGRPAPTGAPAPAVPAPPPATR